MTTDEDNEQEDTFISACTTRQIGRGVLDVRSASAFAAQRLAHSVNIPWPELARRVHELPPPADTFALLAPDTETLLAAVALITGGHSTERLVAACVASPRIFKRIGCDTHPTPHLWRPCAMVEAHADLICRHVEAASSAGQPLLVVDLGCGVGRDVAYLARQLPPTTRYLLMDQRTDLLLKAGALLRHFSNTATNGASPTIVHPYPSLLHCRIMHTDKHDEDDAVLAHCCTVHAGAECPRAAEKSWSRVPRRRLVDVAAQVSLLLIVRYLPPRHLMSQLAALIQRCGLIAFSTFVDDPDDDAAMTWDLRDNNGSGGPTATTYRYASPRGRAHILTRTELAQEHFGPQQGFRVLINCVDRLPEDGRPVQWFVAVKL